MSLTHDHTDETRKSHRGYYQYRYRLPDFLGGVDICSSVILAKSGNGPKFGFRCYVSVHGDLVYQELLLEEVLRERLPQGRTQSGV